jgi:hypothetical protein
MCELLLFIGVLCITVVLLFLVIEKYKVKDWK